MTIQSVKLAKLVLSPINVRQAGEDFIEQLAADIAARGLIQNLIVTPAKKPRGTFAVIAGSRRLRALELLAQRGDIDAASYDVPVLVLSGSDALLSETSLAENFQKLAMNPADECRAFQHFMGTGGISTAWPGASASRAASWKGGCASPIWPSRSSPRSPNGGSASISPRRMPRRRARTAS